jgi:hypothetical protein
VLIGSWPQWETRQEALIALVNGLLDITLMVRDVVAELAAWLKQPASSDLSDLIKTLIASSEASRANIATLGAMITELPADVARAVKDGAVR